MSTRTRFAPSPTGYLHIGGVRTALFNWLYARRHGGQFILRIDDTDAARNRTEAVKPILDGFDWLGIDWDEGPTKDADRKAAEKAKRAYVHRGSNRDVDPAENVRLYKEKPAAVLLKVEDGKTVTFNDHVRGRVDVKTDTIRDPALLRAPGPDGRCGALYSFATVVDEIDFGITHVIRAEEHLSNTPAQILIFEALGTKPPEFAHIPLVNYNNEKMSKRKLPPLTPQEIASLKACGWTEEEIKARDDLNIATVAYYRSLGYLPAALVNYLVRLGWSLDGESEFIPLETVLANFSLDRITKASANFDSKKLYWLQGEYMKLVTAAEKVEKCEPFLRRAGLIGDAIDTATRERLLKIVEAAGDRIKLFSDMVQFAGPLLRRNPIYDPAAIEKSLKPAAAVLQSYRDSVANMDMFDAAKLEELLKAEATAAAQKPNVLVAAVRVAVTGVAVGFGLYETMVILGKDEVLRRMDLALS